MRRYLIIGAVAVSLVASLAYGEIIYQNDFATRTSTGAVPYGGWREQPYVTGQYLNTAKDIFYGSDIQDGWILAREQNECPTAIFDDDGNQEMVFYTNGVSKISVVKQRLGNTFTNGTVTAQCDLRAPNAWVSNGQATLTLGDETFFTPLVSHAVSQSHRVAQVGIIPNGSNGTHKFWYRRISGGNVSVSGANKTSWHRLVMTVNLDTGKWSCDFYDLGTDHPTLETATPATAAYSASNIDLTSTTATGISSIGIEGFYPMGSTRSEDIANAIFFDNIRVWHNGEECYSNDFNTRRSRVFGGTKTATYEANSLLVTNTVGNGTYVVGRNLYPDTTGTSDAQPVGIDGWRRINGSLANTFSVFSKGYNDSTNNPCVGVTDKTYPGIAVQPIGSTLRGGKVRLSADMRTTGTQHDDDIQQNMSVMLGSDVLYNGDKSTYGNGYCARAGLCSYKKMINNFTYRRPQYFEDGASTYPTGEDEWVKQGTWLRIILEVDLDDGTYSVQFRDQGEHPEAWATDGTTIYYEKTGIKFYKPIEEITCYGLVSYFSTVYFDNIKIWHTASGASSARLVYENTFTSRTLYHDTVREGRLIGTLNRDPVGQDGWIRAEKFPSKVSVRNDEENPAMAFGSSDSGPAYALHDIGMLCKNGKMVAQVDAKPPKYWSGNNRATLFWLGGDRFHEGSIKGNDEFYRHAATFFGFRDAVGGTANNVYTNVSLCAWNGNGTGGGSYTNSTVVVDPSHWYRFVATTSIRDGKSDIAVYDMGTEHPTLATATPETPIETFTGIKFRRAPGSLKGISSLCILAQGTSDNTLDKTVGTFWDNIRIDYAPPGLKIVVR